jgi:hypothetical protein
MLVPRVFGAMWVFVLVLWILAQIFPSRFAKFAFGADLLRRSSSAAMLAASRVAFDVVV